MAQGIGGPKRIGGPKSSPRELKQNRANIVSRALESRSGFDGQDTRRVVDIICQYEGEATRIDIDNIQFPEFEDVLREITAAMESIKDKSNEKIDWTKRLQKEDKSDH